MTLKKRTNHCPICTAPVAWDKFMCITHWRMVPLATQREIWRTYRAMSAAQAKKDQVAVVTTGRDYVATRLAAMKAVHKQLAEKHAITTQQPQGALQ
jgi:hypothetical protein